MKHSTSESYSITRCASKTVKPILTNDEWRKNCSAEEFAKWVSDIIYGCKDGDCMACKGIGWCSTQDVIEWLKEKKE